MCSLIFSTAACDCLVSIMLFDVAGPMTTVFEVIGDFEKVVSLMMKRGLGNFQDF